MSVFFQFLGFYELLERGIQVMIRAKACDHNPSARQIIQKIEEKKLSKQKKLLVPADNCPSHTTCPHYFLTKYSTSLNTTYCPRPLISATLQPLKTQLLSCLLANTLRQVALNLYVRLREVSLLLMAIFKLRPVLIIRHYPQKSSPSWRLIHLFQCSRRLP